MPEERKYTLKELQEISQILKNDTSGSFAGTQVGHGPAYAGLPSAGLFSHPGPRPQMLGANVLPVGLMDVLPIHTTTITNPQYDIFTGIQAARGSNANNFCEPGPRAGLAKLCTQTAQFGKFKMKTDPIIINETGGRLNFGDTDRQLLNPQTLPGYLPDVLKRARNINSQDWFMLYATGMASVRAWETVVFDGNRTVTPANAELGFIREFDGLDRLIVTGHVDAITEQACPAADSTVDDWGSALYTATVDGDTIVQRIANHYHANMMNAKNMGLLPMTGALVMHDDFFYALTRVWPCLDMIAGCTPGSNATNNIDAATQREMQNDMFTNRFLWIDGDRVPVILSQAVPLADSGEGFDTTVYFVPFTVLGGYEVFYMEGFNQDNPEIRAANEIIGGNNYQATNNGLWAMTFSMTEFCKEYTIAAQPRIILETPWLAWRIDNINFKLNRYSRQFRPGDPYHYNGGVTIRYSETLYS